MKLLITTAFVAVLLLSPFVIALILSAVELLSYLNQRLSAQINRVDVSEDDIEFPGGAGLVYQPLTA